MNDFSAIRKLLTLTGSILLFVFAIRIMANNPDGYCDGIWIATLVIFFLGGLFALVRDYFPFLLFIINIIMLFLTIYIPQAQQMQSNEVEFYKKDPEAIALLTAKLGENYKQKNPSIIADDAKAVFREYWKEYKEEYFYKIPKKHGMDMYYDEAWYEYETWFKNNKYPSDGRPPLPTIAFMEKYIQKNKYKDLVDLYRPNYIWAN